MSDNIEDLYPLTPLQAGMVYHDLGERGGGLYVNQLSCELRGALDAEAFADAWREALDRNAVLRGAVVWEGVDEPLFVVPREVELPLRREDWRGVPASELGPKLDRLLEDDRRRGFDLGEAPLLRLWLVQTADDTHRFAFTHHHLLLDGWSLPNLLQQVFALYAGRLERRAIAPAPPRPFRDYVEWLQARGLAEAEAFFGRSLCGFGGATPLGLAEGGGREGRGRAHAALSPEVTRALGEFTRKHRLTANTLVQGAWALLLGARTGRRDVTYGTTVSGRPPELPGVEEMVGLFINTLPVRARWSPGEGLVGWLAAQQDQALEARRHGHAPLHEVRRWAGAPPGEPLFESVVVFENYPVDAALRASLPGLEIADLRSVEADHFALSLTAVPGTSLRFTLGHDLARFDEGAAERLLAQFVRLLGRMVERPDARVDDLCALDERERRRIIVDWNATRADFPRDARLHDLVAARARRAPDAVVFEGGGDRWAYARLEARANTIARTLRARGVGPGQRVGVCLGRSGELIAALLAVLKAGAAYVPLDPAYPPERLAYLLEDSGARLLLTDAGAETALPLPHAGLERLRIDRDLDATAAAPEDGGARPDDLAYVIYTSGSTGRPKGVEVTHRSLVNFVTWYAGTCELGPIDRVPLLSGLSFDASALELWPALAAGASVHVPGEDARARPGRLLAWFAERQISVTFAPTPLAEALLREIWPEGLALRVLLTGGDTLRTRPAPGVRARVINLYGPTEATIVATSAEVEAQAEGALPPIGRPIANARTYVLDDTLAPLPIGAPGELFVGGAGVARGYLGRPALTAERFRPDPFAPEPGARMYATGDRARFLPDGRLEFLGRVDRQIKLRGYRIELGEIEAALCEIADVAEGAVVLRKSAAGEDRLVAYAVPHAGRELDPDALRETLGRRLPAYMLPSAVVLLRSLPLTPQGKVDRDALPSLDAEDAGAGPEGGEPRGVTEEMLASIWGELLGREKVGRDANFFELGGHSLSSMQLASRVRDTFGIELSVRAAFEAPNLRQLAALIDQIRRGEHVLPPVVASPGQGPAPLSFAQERLWFLDRLRPGDPAYNVPLALRLRGPLDVEALRAALGALFERHDVLRTVFVDEGGRPSQRVEVGLSLELPVERLEGQSDETLRRRVEAEAGRPFDLAKGPLLRTKLLRLADDDHALVLTAHHVVCDAWSLGIFASELSSAYGAFTRSEALRLPELPVRYADYATWQRKRLGDEALAGELDWWRAKLEDAPPALELPTDRPRPATQSLDGGLLRATLPPGTSSALREFCRREGVTPFMALLAAFYALLWRQGGQGDLVVGTPVAGRPRPELEPLVGLFLNTLALRVRVEGVASFRELAGQVREATLGALAHQDLPFERLVEALSPRRDPSRSPLFQAMFVHEGAPPSLALPGVEASPLDFDPGSAKFDLTLFTREGAGRLECAWEYDRALFDAETIERLSARYGRLLEAALADPDQPLASFRLSTESERQQLLAAGLGAPAPTPPAPTLHALFEAQASLSPDAPALRMGSERLSYDELDRRAERLAQRLRARGVGRDMPVGLCALRSFDLATGVLGILKAGGACLPLDPAYPPERLAHALRDAGARFLLVQRPLEPALPTGGPERLFFDEAEAFSPAPEGSPSREAKGAAGPNSLAYVLYTSGSTGVPKGVAMPHGPLVNLVAWQVEASRTPAAATLQFAALGFDVFFQELFATWAGGGEVVLIDEALRRDPRALLHLLDEGGIERLFLPFVALEALAEAADHEGLAPRRLREVVTAGEALRVTPTLRRFFSRLPDATLHNQYGPTESHVVTAFMLEGDPQAWPELPPIGRPIAGAKALVLDERLEPAPIGVPGELYLGGAPLARGYSQRPTWTAERFVPDPFGPTGARLYRSGDIARLLPSGDLAFLGRRDAQVKVRGHRVELGEIEAALAAHNAVATCTVDTREGPGGHTQLVAYVVGREGRPPPSADELVSFLRGRLPDFMLPSAIVALEALPLSPNGKVDRRSLPAPGIWGRSSRPPYVEPSTATEARLAELWAELLGVERPGALDDFFDLGGHSLLATRLVSRVRDAFSVELPLRELFEAPTLRELASRIDATAASATPAPAPRRRAPGEAPALSFGQQRLWFLDRLTPQNAAYNVPVALRLTGTLDAGLLARSLSALAQRHEALRTTFNEQEGLPIACIHSGFFSPPLREVDLRARGDGSEGTLADFAADEAARPFDLRSGPLIRAALARLGEREHALLLTAHHAVTDGWSTAIMVRELALFYEAFGRNETPRLPDLPLQYADYAAWQHERLEGPWLRAELDHWKHTLEGAPRLELPEGRQRQPGPPSRRAGRVVVSLTAALAERLRALASAEGCTPFMALLAAFQALLARYTGQHDLSVGTPVAGRTHLEFEGLIGFFVNTLVLRTRAEPSGSFRALLGRVREACLDAFAHQELPFERLVEELRPERDLSGTPLFRVFFSLLNAPRAEATLGGLTFTPIALPIAAAKFDLSLRLEEREGGVEGELEYRTDLFEPATAERLTRHLSALLAAAVARPDAPLDRLQLSDESERATLRSWQPPALAPDPLAPTFPQAFAAQAARTPDARALVCGGVSLSYRELDARSNRVAHLLRRHGVGPETRVALFVERSAEMLVAMLGVLKSGGAYVPLDPTHPPGRHATIVAATRPLVTLTQARLLGSAPPDAGALIALDLDPDPSADLPESPPPGPPAESAAYVIFTSGSTGVPKGVVVEHRQLVSYARAVARRLGLPAGSSGATVSSAAADLGYTAVFPPLLDGGCVHIVPEALVADADGLAEHFARHPVDYLKIVPAHLQALLAARLPERVLPRLALVFGGDTTPWSLVDRVHELAPSCRVMNHYGPTETTVGVVAGPIDDAPSERPSKPPLGRPLEGSTIYLLDRSLEPVPIGAVGELFVGGAGVARGYLGRPAQTAERFLPDPFGPPGSRLYRTGDLARHLPDGRIIFLGRADHQIKVRGFRVELGEIEAALSALPGVRRAAAALRDGRLVAYVSIADTTVAALDEQLRASLPPASVPSVIVELDDWPMLPSGKLDRARLPEPSAAPRARIEPRTPAEQTLAALWQELLGVEQVGADDNFFDLGGHSLLATQLVARIRRALGVELPLRALFEAPTLAALAARVDSAPPCVGEPLLRRDDASSTDAPLSPAQERLWFLQRLDPESPAYNVPFALRLEGTLDRRALEGALDALARRHEILRSAFRIEAGEPIQRVDPSFTLRPRFVDLGALEPAAREASARALLEAEIGRPFSFEQGPPARALLAALGEREHLLVVTLHHALTDGWSRPILAREFALFYEAFARNETPHLPVLPLQYTDYAAWQRAWLTGPQPEEQLAYWKRTLAGAPRLELPTDRPRPPTPTRRAGSQSVVVSEELASALVRVGRNVEATPFVVLLAAYAVLLSRHCGQRDLSIGTPTAGRTRVEFEGLVGLFVNTLVLRLDFADDPTFAELVARARDATLGAQEHQDLPFERVVAALDVGRDHALSPLFQTMFVLHNAPRLALELPGLTLESLPLAAPAAKFDLSLTLAEHDGGFEGAFEYDADLFEPDTVARLAERFLALLQGAAGAPDRRTSELPIMPEAERRKLLVEWNATAVERPERHRGIHELIEAQAARTPSAIAAIFEDDRLTYAELNARADRLAADLRERGVRDGAFVAIRMSRCLEVPVAMLGVLKAGAAFSPLDMRWPEGRTRQIVDQLGPGPIVTTPGAAPSTPAGCSTIVVDAKAPLRAAPASPRRVDPESPIYAIFTSGSTGVPKGVVVPHRGITNRFLWMNSAFGAEAARAVLQTTHHVYDSAVWQLFWPLINGGTTVLCAPGREADAAYLTARIARHGVTMTDLVPSVFVTILPQILRDDGARDGLGSLRALVVGGEEIGAGAAHAFLGRFPGVRLVNLYGPTEASIGCIAYTITGREPGRIPIGQPIANTQALVLDEARRPVPIGVRGELYLGGACLGLGYLGDEAKTTAAFVDNPFAEIASTKLYRTGDLARWRPDGELEFLGRADRQVKIRGLRIELGEIEAALAAHSAMGACAVEAREGPGGDRELVAYLVPAPGESSEGLEESAEAFARERLPGYLVPARFVVLDALPSTAGGKLDRRALPAPAPRQPAPAGRAPRDERERALVQIWQEELGASPLGVDDDFFDLGGHSLRALRALPRIEAALGREVPLALLFERPTVASLLEALDTPAAGPAPCLQVLRAGGERAPLVLVHAVEGHAFVYRELARALAPGRPVYALRARGLEPGEDPAADVETMAERYLEELRHVCPRGPYVLGGWSMGGSVAFAMAHRLAREGEAPPLALLDAFAPTGEPFGPENELALLAALGDELARRAGLAVEGPTIDEFRQIPETDRLAYLRERALGGRPLPPEFAALRPEALARVSVANARALASYRPAPYPGPTLLVQARGRREGRRPPEQGWAPLAPNLRVEDIEGDHHSIVRPPHVEALARALDRWLGQYEPAPPRPAG